MWQNDGPKGGFKKTLIIAEIVAISVVVISIAAFVWQNAGIGSLDKLLQVAFVGFISLLVVFVANYVINRRW